MKRLWTKQLLKRIGNRFIVGLFLLVSLPLGVVAETVTSSSSVDEDSSAVIPDLMGNSGMDLDTGTTPSASFNKVTDDIQNTSDVQITPDPNQESKPDTSEEKAGSQKKNSTNKSNTADSSTKELSQATRGNITEQVKVLEWAITNSTGNTVGEDVAAISNQAHDFSFKAQVGSVILGDTIAFEIPQVQTGVSTDHWYMQPSEWVIQTFDEDEPAVKVYQYRVQTKYDTTTQKSTQEIQIEFLNDFSGLELNMVFPEMLVNFVKTAGTFPVTFGKEGKNSSVNTQNVEFKINELKLANGFSFKTNSAVSNNSVKWGIQFNGAGNLELAGDEVNYNVNGGNQNPYQGFYLDNPLRTESNWHQWGSRYTDIWSPNVNNQATSANYGGYIEDVLPPGAKVTRLSIAAYVNLPLGLTNESLTTETGGYPTTQAAFQSYVLDDQGEGPSYRGSESAAIQKPKSGTGFSLLTQNAGETETAFKTRVQSLPYQYGIYTDSSNRQTIMIHFGNMKSASEGNQQEKLSDLTDNEEYTGESFVNKDGKTVTIPKFAVIAADNTIKDQRSGYTEEHRSMLEKYFTLVYGDSNVLNGGIASYNISLDVRYAPETTGEILNTSNIYTHSALTLIRKAPETMPKRDNSTAQLKNPYGNITLTNSEVLLQKLDADHFDNNGDYIPLDGAEFKLQKQVNGTWDDITDDDGQIKTWTTGTVDYVEEGETISLHGLIRLDIATLFPGQTETAIYRFVEVNPPSGYSETDSPNWNNQAQAIVSENFEIPSRSSKGPTVTVWNKRKQATYRVEHYVQKEESSESELDPVEDFDLAEEMTITSEVGNTVTASPLMSLQTTHFYNPVYTSTYGKTSGIVTDSTVEEELVLKLYYTKDEESSFTVYKLDNAGNPMPSVGEKKVQFKLYSYDYTRAAESGVVISDCPPTAANIAAGYWSQIWDDGTLLSRTKGPGATELILETDAAGRIRDSRITGSAVGGTLALVEICNGYPGYSVVPSPTENYWVFYLKDGYLDLSGGYGEKAFQPIKYQPLGSSKTYFAIVNKLSEFTPDIYKIDENGNPMPSTDDQKVEFDIYEYDGPEDVRPDNVTSAVMDHNNPLGVASYGSSMYSKLWVKLDDDPFVTNHAGKIVKADGSPLELNPKKFYSVIEISTYDNYQLPDNQFFSKNRTNHWLINTSGLLKTGYGYVDSRPVQWLAPMYEKSAQYAVTTDGIYLQNRPLTPVPIFKVDENLNPILQSSGDQFKFQVWLFDNTTTTDNYQNIKLTEWQWKSISQNALADSFQVNGNGRIFTEDLSVEKRIGRTEVQKEQIVAIRETKGMTDYEYSDGNYWVVKLVWDVETKTNKVTSIEYFTTESDGTLKILDSTADIGTDRDSTYFTLLNGEAYLKNTRIQNMDFTFYKEDQQQNPLAGVEFALYKVKNSRGDPDPNHLNTKWDITDEPYRESISSDRDGIVGEVNFKGLVSGEYLLIETKTLDGFTLPQGYWILTVDAETKTIEIAGSTDPQPPAFRIEASTYYLPNFKKTSLPISGSTGKIVMVILGSTLLGFSLLVLVNPKKQRKTV